MGSATLAGVLNVLGSIVGLAMLFYVITSPQTASIIRAFASLFVGGLRAATGR